MPESCVGPQHALGSDAFTSLSQIHGDCSPEEVFYLFVICVDSNPSGTAKSDTPEDESGQLTECDAIQVRREQTSHVLLVTN
jgi:hypothetical protein